MPNLPPLPARAPRTTTLAGRLVSHRTRPGFVMWMPDDGPTFRRLVGAGEKSRKWR